jgi:opacity protein-like surface antigen
MKKIILTTLAVIFTLGICFAQDVITKKSGEDIKAKISEITTTQIKYYRFDNLKGPIYSIDKSEVLMIRYANGTKDIFSDSNKSTEKIASNNDAQVKQVEITNYTKPTSAIPAGTFIKGSPATEVDRRSDETQHSLVRFGVRAGLNLANASINGLSDGMTTNINPSFHIGGVAEYGIAQNFALEAGLFLSGKGTKMEYSDTQNGVTVNATVTMSPLCLEIPINAIYKIDLGNAKLDIFAGPYIAFGVSGTVKTTYTASNLPSGYTLSDGGLNDESRDIKYGTNADDDIKGTDFGLNFGAGVEINNFQIRAQYGLSLTNLDPQGLSDNAITSNVISISVGYMFGK